jgi:hypothetical protein
MMPCPLCGSSTSVVETRRTGNNIRRRRCCGQGHRVTTVEVALPSHMSSRGHGPDLVAVPRADLEAIRAATDHALGSAVVMPKAEIDQPDEVG